MNKMMCTYNNKFNGLYSASHWFGVPSFIDPKASRKELGCLTLEKE